MTPIRQCCLVLSVAVLAVAGCGSDTESRPDSTTIVATMSIWADITEQVACDGLADVVTLIPRGGDPHAFEPSIRDRVKMEQAALVVTNGLGLEQSLGDTIDAVESNGTVVLRVAEGLDPLVLGDARRDDADDHGAGRDGHDHGDLDPHVWWDPQRVADALPSIAQALGDAGIDRSRLDACVSRYADELATLDREVEAIVDELPLRRRLLVTDHDSLGYFADRYDFTVIGAVIPSSSTLAESSPAALDDLAAKIVAADVSAIFAEARQSTSDTAALARRVGDVEVVTLATDTLGEPGSTTGDYVGWLRSNVRTIVDALTPVQGS